MNIRLLAKFPLGVFRMNHDDYQGFVDLEQLAKDIEALDVQLNTVDLEAIDLAFISTSIKLLFEKLNKNTAAIKQSLTEFLLPKEDKIVASSLLIRKTNLVKKDESRFLKIGFKKYLLPKQEMMLKVPVSKPLNMKVYMRLAVDNLLGVQDSGVELLNRLKDFEVVLASFLNNEDYRTSYKVDNKSLKKTIDLTADLKSYLSNTFYDHNEYDWGTFNAVYGNWNEVSVALKSLREPYFNKYYGEAKRIESGVIRLSSVVSDLTAKVREDTYDKNSITKLKFLLSHLKEMNLLVTHQAMVFYSGYMMENSTVNLIEMIETNNFKAMEIRKKKKR